MPDILASLRGRDLPVWSRLPLAFACGLLMGLGTAPFDLWYVALIGLVGAFWLFDTAPRATKEMKAAGIGWMVGLGYFGSSMAWIVEPFMVDAKATGWMAPFGLLGLAGGLALFWAVAFWAAALAPRRAIPALVLTWTAAELSRAYVLTGFPWGLIGYLWLPVSPIQWVSLVGPHGLTFLTLALAALLAAALPALHRRTVFQPRLLAAVLGGTLLFTLFGVGKALTPPLQDLSGRPVVRLIQPNAPQHEKWDPLKIPVFYNRQITYTAAPTATGGAPDLVVWPETALPGLLRHLADELGQVSHAAGKAQVIAGLQRADGGRWYNSLVLMAPDGDLKQVYDKYHLVPFGEYMPAKALFEKINIMGLAARAEGGYSPGPGPTLLDLDTLGTALPLICYEAVFPQDVYRAPARPDMLIQITNDAWFGTWSGPYQHLEQARVRAIEQGLPMLRSANTGVSAAIDGAGRVLAEIPLGEAGYVDAALPPPLRRTVYSRTGDLPTLITIFLLGGFLLRIGRKERESESH
jgi:apolipoprotein N-acyltransferase